MESILDKINESYRKGIGNPRFQKAINEIIKSPEKENTTSLNREMQEVTSVQNTTLEKNIRASQGEER